MDTRFRPTHELFDEDGESCGLYWFNGGHYSSADVWFNGGRVLLRSEVTAWGWTAKPLTALVREHYVLFHGETGGECHDGCGGG